METVSSKPKKIKVKKAPPAKEKPFKRFAKITFWFALGIIIGFFFFVSFIYLSYRTNYTDKIYEGVYVNGTEFGGDSREKIKNYFAKKNKDIQESVFTLSSDDTVATISAKQIDFGYDEDLLSQQAYTIGRSGNLLSDISIVLQAYVGGIHLPPATHYKEERLDQLISPLSKKINTDPVEGLFNFENGRVVAFKLSKNGKGLDKEKLKSEILSEMNTIAASGKPHVFVLNIPIKIIEPKVSTEKLNNYGIKELVAEGTSLFGHSIENRIYNVNLAASRINGALIKPGATFSFVKTVGDITSLTGYKQAYVISGGKTVLGDGGGVCQVSTTLFRAALNAGLPIVERNQHAYRVGYYEEDSPPGIDAAIYSPSVDLKFKNDTGHYILIQTVIDLQEQRLTFQLFGTRDTRETIINKPVILSQSAAPETEYQDDPTLPKGQTKQIDFAAGGANVYFTRSVKKDGKTIADDKFVSNYRPWKAVYLRGTKE